MKALSEVYNMVFLVCYHRWCAWWVLVLLQSLGLGGGPWICGKGPWKGSAWHTSTLNDGELAPAISFAPFISITWFLHHWKGLDELYIWMTSDAFVRWIIHRYRRGRCVYRNCRCVYRRSRCVYSYSLPNAISSSMQMPRNILTLH